MMHENQDLPGKPSAPIGFAPSTGSGVDFKDKAVIRGLVSALAAYCCATESLVVKNLTGILWTEEEANEILPNAKRSEPGEKRDE